MNTIDTLTTLFDHNRWANLRLLEQCAVLTAEQLNATVVGTYGTLRDTLQHIATSEQSYFSRISTGKRTSRPEGAPDLTMAEIADSLKTTGAGLVEWATKIQAQDTVEIDWDGTPVMVPKSIVLSQVINHATEHRAQVTAIMTQLGIEPPNLQPWEYFDELYMQKSSG